MTRLVATFVLAAIPAIAAGDVVEIVNSVRERSACASSAETLPLRAEPRLDDAARMLAGGADLDTATAASGYPAKLSASIRIRILREEDSLSQILAHRFCDIIGDARLAEIGTHSYGAEIWLLLATPFAPQDSVDPAALVQRVFELINLARVRGRDCGRKSFPPTHPLQVNHALETAAHAHAQDMARGNFLGHEGSTGSMPGGRAASAGYEWSSIGENVAAGQATADEVIDTWLGSPGHCENLMSPAYTETGISYATDRSSDKGVYWVQVFGKGKQ